MKKILETLLRHSDAALVVMVQGGNKQAFDALVNRWSKKMLPHLTVLLHSKEEAKDTMQDTWLFVYELLMQHHYHEQGTFGGWLFKIAHSIARQHRKEITHFVHDEKILDLLATFPASSEMRSIPFLQLKKAFGTLSARMKQVVKLHVIKNLSLRETALKLNLSPGTVADYYKEAIARMHTYLLAQGVTF